MEKVINNKAFVNLRDDIKTMMEALKDLEIQINENVRDLYNLDEFDVIIEGKDEEILKKYETIYIKFSQIIVNKNNAIMEGNETINELEQLIDFLLKLTVKNDWKLINEKEMENADEIIKCVNQLVDKILEKETSIFNNKLKKFDKQKEIEKIKFEKRKQEIIGMKFPYYCHHDIPECEIKNNNKDKVQIVVPKVDLGEFGLNNLTSSIDCLMKWSGKNGFKVIFNSEVDGDGKNSLEERVFGKRNLYFISSSSDDNIFGGYMDELINKKGEWIADPKSFVFSLKRNGKVVNTKYLIKEGWETRAFYLCSKSDTLYSFGCGPDIIITKIGNSSFFNPSCYDYRKEKNPFGVIGNGLMKQIVVLEMS